VLKNEPSALQALKFLADAHARNNESDLARDALEQGLKLAPGDTELRLALARLHFNNDEMNKTIATLQMLLQQQPDHRAALELLIDAQIRANDLTAASASAKKLIAAQPQAAAGYYYHGKVFQAQRQYASAIGQYQRALKLEPSAIEPLSSLVMVLLRQNQADQAMAEIDRLLKVNPQNIAAHNFKGEILLYKRQPQQAIREFEQVISLNPAFVLGYRNLAAAYIANEDTEAAVQVYRKALASNGDAPVFRVQLAAMYEQIGRIDEAIGEYETLVESDPASQIFANNLAMLLVNYRADPQSLQRAGELTAGLTDTRNPAFLDTVGWVHYKAGRYDMAIPALDQAMRLSPDSLLVRYHLGMAYYKKGDAQQARQHLELVLQQQQNFPGREDARKVLAELTAG
jgi:tetratricopeptide (TPR) repeat protein